MKRKALPETTFVAVTANNCRRLLLSLISVLTLQAYSQPQLVRDINTEVGYGLIPDSEYSNFTAAGDNLYYVIHGNELWRTATAGTTAFFVKEVAGISNLTNVNGRLFFTAGTTDTGFELWKSDGTTASTVLVKDIRAGVDSSSPYSLTDVGGTLFFVANDGRTGVELWKSDGSMSGTVMVKDIAHGSSYPSNLIESNGLLSFSAHDGHFGYEMWKSDGTSGGTSMISDIRPGFRIGSNPQKLIDVNGKVFFTALKPTGERRLYVTDGTDGGTKLVNDGAMHVKFMTNVNGTLFFAGTDAVHGEELWKSDGSPEGTVAVRDITPGPRSEHSYGIPHLSYFTSMGDKLYFFAHDERGQSLWVSDGTENGTMPIVFGPEISFTWIDPNPIAFRGNIYFNADLMTGENDLTMMRTDGTQGGEEIFLEDITSVWDSPQPRIVANDFLYIMSHGNLWKTDGTNKFFVRSPFTSTQSSNPEQISDVDGVVYFVAYDGQTHGLWKSDATRAGTRLVKRFGGPVTHLTRSGNYLYYLARAVSATSPTYQKLWRTELTTGGTRVLSNINSDGDDAIGELADADGILYFSAIAENGQVQLWKTEGERANTVLVKNFNNTRVPIIHLTTVGKHVFFSTASQSRPNDALWKSDGTSVNTNIIKVFNTIASNRRAITEMIRVNQKIFYIAYDGYDYEIWKTNGSGSGTIRLKDIQSDDEDVIDIAQLTNIDNTLYFAATGVDEHDHYTRDLWKSDATTTGTVKVTTFPGLSTSPVMDNVYILAGLNGGILVGLLTQYEEGELWTTDGTSEGTQMLGAMPASEFREQIIVNNVLYFTTFSSVLWRSDGTVCGTFVEFGHQPAHGAFGDLTYSNEQILLAYQSPSVGRELFTYNPQPPPCAPSVARTNTESEPIITSPDEKLATYPNPFITECSIRLEGPEGESYQAVIRDLYGMQQGEIMHLQFNIEYNLGAGLRRGIYSLVVRKHGQTVVTKIVKSI